MFKQYAVENIFPEASVKYLAAIKSDHRPIILYTSSTRHSHPKPFRFEEMWIRGPLVGLVIVEAWEKGAVQPTLPQLMTKIKYTKMALKQWNKMHFGHLQSHISALNLLTESIQTLLMGFRLIC